MTQDFGIIVSQGRVADRTDGALRGAHEAASALAAYLERQPIVVGTPSPAVVDDWTAALPAAQETLEGLRDAVTTVLDAGQTPLLLTNTCAASLGTLPTAARRHPRAVVLWIDAHGDFNTPQTSESGYLGGMVLAAACGLWDSGHGAGVNPEQVIVVGARDIDPAEADLLAEAGVRTLSPGESSPSGSPSWSMAATCRSMSIGTSWSPATFLPPIGWPEDCCRTRSPRSSPRSRPIVCAASNWPSSSTVTRASPRTSASN